MGGWDFYILLLVFFAGFFVLVELPVLIAAFSMAPWVPTRNTDLARIEQLLDLKDGEVFYELGCGDGRVCRYVAEKNPEAKVFGFELAYPLYLWSAAQQVLQRRANLTIKLKNVFNLDLAPADAIYLFGLKKTLNKRLKSKFENELRKGTKILVYDDPIDGWKTVEVNRPTPADVPIYVYVKS